MRCISFDSYIKPQRCAVHCRIIEVVYLLTPTSNHNKRNSMQFWYVLYIFWLLHQTTTILHNCQTLARCISFDSYIKPQHTDAASQTLVGCISFDSYIKPQPQVAFEIFKAVVYLLTPTSNHNLSNIFFISLIVVYLLTPTSNHNSWRAIRILPSLYIFWLLHQTTTCPYNPTSGHPLYIFWLLHQTTTCEHFPDIELMLYIFWLLHQTTTVSGNYSLQAELYIFWLLHQTTTWGQLDLVDQWLYIFWLLHQTTTRRTNLSLLPCCISFDSYIKPQLLACNRIIFLVVYLLTPTSNHNRENSVPGNWQLYIFWLLHQTTTQHLTSSQWVGCISFDSYIKPQRKWNQYRHNIVVYLLTPTSNHNEDTESIECFQLYIFWLLHQTTTDPHESPARHCCISFDSYIKPQRGCEVVAGWYVVYLLTPTSNHNGAGGSPCGVAVVYLLTPTSNHNR